MGSKLERYHQNMKTSTCCSVKKISLFLFFAQAQCDGAIFNPTATFSTTTNPPVPQYRFHYYVRDDKTGDYKAQEEHRTGDFVTGSYVVGEPNGDLRVVKYAADVNNGFKADVNVQPGGSPLKVTTIPSAMPMDGRISYNNHRTGISAPPKYHRKPQRGFNPIIVKSVPMIQPAQIIRSMNTSYDQSYRYYKDTRNDTSNIPVDSNITAALPVKSVQVDLTYKDDINAEKSVEAFVLQDKKLYSESTASAETVSNTIDNRNHKIQPLPYLAIENSNIISKSIGPTTETIFNNYPDTSTTTATAGNLYQLSNVDIAASVMEILNSHKADIKKSVDSTTTLPIVSYASKYKNFNDESSEMLKIDLSKVPNKNTVSAESAASNYKKLLIPQRPMRLIGLSPIYLDNSQLQTITDNLTSIPQIQLEPITNIQYATPMPFITGPLLGGPPPFRNIPRSVSDASADILINSIPIVNSIPISAPIIPPQQLSHVDPSVKQEIKSENKPIASPTTLPLCNDCLLPPNYISPYSMMKMPPSTNTGAVASNHQKPCTSNNAPPPYWTPYAPSLAYILMPTQLIKSKMNVNEHRPIPTAGTR